MEYVRTQEIEGTSYQGKISATYTALVAALGEPDEGSADGKTQAEWALRFEDGTVITIYDYKMAPVPREQVNTWNIGGRHPSAVEYAELVLLLP